MNVKNARNALVVAILFILIYAKINCSRYKHITYQTFTCSNSALETLEKGVRSEICFKNDVISGVLIVNFEYIVDLFLIVDFQQANACLVKSELPFS